MAFFHAKKVFSNAIFNGEKVGQAKKAFSGDEKLYRTLFLQMY